MSDKKELKEIKEIDSYGTFKYLWNYSWRSLGMHPWTGYKYLYYLYSLFANLFGSVTSQPSQFVYLFFAPDINSILKNLPMNMTFTLSVIKFYGIWFAHRRTLLSGEIYLKQLDARAIRNENETKLLLQIKKAWGVFYFVFTSMYFWVLFLNAIVAIVKSPPQLIWLGWFPFDEKKYFWHAYLYQFFSTFYMCIKNSSNDYYSMCYISVLAAHTRALNMRIERVGWDKKSSKQENYEELVLCIKDHKLVINFFDSIKSAISWTLFIQLVGTALIVGITAVKMLFFETTFLEWGSSAYYIVVVYSEIAPQCYFANEFMIQHQELTTSIFKSNWIEQTEKYRKTCIMFMIRTQKYNVLTAGGLMTISIPTFIAVVKFTFSLFTMLSQMN